MKGSAIVVPEAHLSVTNAARSQSTSIEQTRAVAEVHGAIMVAQRCPRDKQRAVAEMRESCRIQSLAERAFFRFPRGGQTVSGASVHLARELARCWGNLDYGIKELARDDDAGASEMLAFAWDMETNTRSETTFIVPHKRDKRGGAEVLTDMRDIYENNANNGARRLRECIFAILPPWYTEEAKELCSETLKSGGGKPRDVRLADCIKAFEAIGVSRDRLEKKIGAAAAQWTDVDLANLTVVYKSIRRGEVRVDDEFQAPEAPAEAPSRLDALEATISDPPAAPPSVGDAPADESAPPIAEPAGARPLSSYAATGAGEKAYLKDLSDAFMLVTNDANAARTLLAEHAGSLKIIESKTKDAIILGNVDSIRTFAEQIINPPPQDDPMLNLMGAG